uniref:Uncharacterized protein n=1 Tax=Globisporangium ultimum (strain ATCC 200006 / CBS 805.95 / DAOM BR144) TaxID=431595 RepID=K3WBQ0_GLOUD
MEALDAGDVVTERAIFASFGAPPVDATPAGARFLRGASPSTTESSLVSSSPWMLPPVGTGAPASTAGSTQTIVASPRHIGSLTLLPPKTPRSLMNSFPITADQCGIVAMEVPATIPRFGTVTLKVHAMNIRMPFFEPDQTFLETFALQLMKPTDCSPSYSRANSTSNAEPNSQTSKASGVFAFNYLEMASYCGSAIDAAKAQEWLQAVVQKIGQAMNHCKHKSNY